MKRIAFLLVASVLLAFWGGSVLVAQEEAPAGEQAAPAALGKAETISGTISMVSTDERLVVVAGSSGVPYNFKVTGATRIRIDGKRAKLADLAEQTKKKVSVKFIPRRSGNIAQSIEVSQ